MFRNDSNSKHPDPPGSEQEKMQKDKVGKMTSNRRAGLHEDRDRWEENRLIGSVRAERGK